MIPSQRWLLRIALVWIIIMTLFSFRIVRIDAGMEFNDAVALAVTVFLLFVAVSTILTTRYLFLPHADLVPEERKHLTSLSSYVMASSPAVYGLVTALFTGQALVSLPFGAMALVGLFLVWSYLREASDASG